MTSPPLSPAGKITLFLDGFGVELDASRIAGTRLRDGDSVSHDTLDILAERPRP